MPCSILTSTYDLHCDGCGPIATLERHMHLVGVRVVADMLDTLEVPLVSFSRQVADVSPEGCARHVDEGPKAMMAWCGDVAKDMG